MNTYSDNVFNATKTQKPKKINRMKYILSLFQLFMSYLTGTLGRENYKYRYCVDLPSVGGDRNNRLVQFEQAGNWNLILAFQDLYTHSQGHLSLQRRKRRGSYPVRFEKK